MTRSAVGGVFAEEWPKLVGVLVGQLGDLALAEDVAQEAFASAAERWGPDFSPDNPGAWLLTTARRKAIDQIRRDRRFEDRVPILQASLDREPEPAHGFVDDHLALIFGCCHPTMSADAQVALTLREVCGLSTHQIATAFLVSEPTMAKRLVRAKTKIREAGVPFEVPGPDRLPERLSAVLHTIYLIFTEGYSTSTGAALVRGDLCDEAAWLADLVRRMLPDEPEVLGLAALIGFADARRATRTDLAGALVLLEDQDRSRWDREAIEAADALLEQALRMGRVGPFQLEAAIAGVHATAASIEETDWNEIVGLYALLESVDPSPIVSLNRVVALSQARGPAAGLEALGRLEADGSLDDYRYFHAARADMLRRVGRTDEARAAYERAIDLGGNDSEQSFLRSRIDQLGE